MAFTKFATFEVLSAEIGSGAKKNQRVATFNKAAHRHEFEYDPKPGFLYVRSRAISSRCNDNFDEFPASEIRQAYASFVGKPVFVNHHNENHRRARGVIIDAALHEDTNPDGSPDTWCEVLMEVDALKFPKLAQAILAGHIDRTSMGTDVEYSLCSFCGNKAQTPVEYCAHIPRLKGKRIRRTTASGEKTDVLVREICYGLRFFENSLLVEEPADPTAFFLGVDARGVGGSAQAGSGAGTSPTLSPKPLSWPVTASTHGLSLAASLIHQAFEDDKKRKRLHYVHLPLHAEHAHGLLYDLMQGNDNCVEHHESIDWPDGGSTTAEFSAKPGTPEWDREALNKLAHNGGFSVHRPNGDEPSTGYMCADGQNEMVVGSMSALTPQVIQQFLDRHADKLNQSDYYFGGWLDTDSGKVYLDVSQHFSDLNTALRAAKGRGELAVYDIGTGESVYVKDHPVAASKTAGFYPDGNADVGEANMTAWEQLNYPLAFSAEVKCNEHEAEEIQSQFPKYVKLKPFPGFNKDGAVSLILQLSFYPNDRNGGANEVSIKRYRAFMRILSGMPDIKVKWSNSFSSNAYPSQEAFEEALARYEEAPPNPGYRSSLSKAASLVKQALASEAHDPANRSEYIGKCADCGSKFCWPNDDKTSGVRAHVTDTRFRCPNVTCGGTVKQTTRQSGPFTHIEDSQVSSLQRFAYGDTMAPAEVDTLRDEFCPVCKESDSFDGDRCQVCGYEQPPEEFTDPNTDLAKQVDLRQDQDDKTGDAVEGDLECTNCGHTFDSANGGVPPEATPLDPETPVDANGQPVTPPAPELAAPQDPNAPQEIDPNADPNDPNAKPVNEDDPNKITEDKGPINPANGEPQKRDEGEENHDKTDPDNAAKPDPDPATDPAKVLDSNRTKKSPTPDVLPPAVPSKSSDPAKPSPDPTQGTEGNTGTNPQHGDKCPDCGEGQLQQKSTPDAKGAPPQNGAPDPNKADDEGKPDGKSDGDDDSGDKSDGDKKPDDKDSGDDDKDKKNSPPWLKNKKSHIEGTEVDMRPALAALVEQQKVIEAQAGDIAQLKRAVATVLELAGIANHPKIASLFEKTADVDNPAQPVPAPASEGPAETTEEARAPEGKDDPTNIGSSPVTDTAPEAVTDPTTISTSLDVPLDLNKENVEAPVAGTETQRPESETRTETDVRVGNPDNTSTMFPWGLGASKSEGRTFASLRLARLQMQAGIASGEDDIAVAQVIEKSAATDEAIQSEIETITKVLTASKFAAKGDQPRNLVPQGTNKTARAVPSFASEEQPLIREALMVSGPNDDEFMFE